MKKYLGLWTVWQVCFVLLLALFFGYRQQHKKQEGSDKQKGENFVVVGPKVIIKYREQAKVLTIFDNEIICEYAEEKNEK